MRVSRRFVILGVIAVACVIGLIFLGHWLGWETGFGPETTEPKQHAKTLWDWMQLLIIPAVLAVAGYAINFTINRNDQKSTQLRDQTEREIALDNQREAALQAYFDRMSELILDKDFNIQAVNSYVQSVVQARTLTVLRRLDTDRKASVLQFLSESELIHLIDLNRIDLSGANLNGVNLKEAKLVEANLERVELSFNELNEADLFEANLSGANLIATDFTGANLTRANLSGANLEHAFLKNAKLGGADLTQANLRLANLTQAQLININFTKSDLTDANLTDANLTAL